MTGEQIRARSAQDAAQWDAMSWQERFWVAWQALVVMESRYESALSELEPVREELRRAKSERATAMPRQVLSPGDAAKVIAERNALVRSLRKDGFRYSEIGQACGISGSYARAIVAFRR